MWRVHLIAFFCVAFLAWEILGSKVKVYHMNKHLGINVINQQGKKPDCLYYMGNYSAPENFTFCHRMKAFQYTTVKKVLFIMSLGIIDSGFTDMKRGFTLGYWTSGPFFGIKHQDSGFNWIGHSKVDWKLHQWTHICFTYSLVTGSYKIVVDGEILFEKMNANWIKFGKTFHSPFNFLSVGCTYRSESYKYVTMHGRITDIQVWDAELNTAILKSITSCKNMKEKGTLFNWQTTKWTFDNPRQLSEVEEWDLEEICDKTEQSLTFLPYLSTFKNSVEQSCRKLSGTVAGYVTEKDFHSISMFLLKNKFFAHKQCMYDIKGDTHELVGWLRFTDHEEEGRFVDIFSKKEPKYLPWLDNRPVIDGKSFNCFLITISADVNGERVPNVRKSLIKDEDCHTERCSLCEIPQLARKIEIRGLCKESIFDRSYFYTVSDDGRPLYVGIISSAIWYDSKKGGMDLG